MNDYEWDMKRLSEEGRFFGVVKTGLKLVFEVGPRSQIERSIMKVLWAPVP